MKKVFMLCVFFFYSDKEPYHNPLEGEGLFPYYKLNYRKKALDLVLKIDIYKHIRLKNKSVLVV